MTELKKKLNLYGLTMIAVGSCIGSGIFVTPYQVVQAVPHQGYVLLIWILGGVIALTGALTFAELGAMFPNAGGVYVFLKEAYGDLTGFAYGWVTLLVINTGALAALGMAFSEYLTFFFPLAQSGKVAVAIVVVSGLTLINMVGVQVSQVFANVFTGLKLLAMAGIVGIGLFFYDPDKVELNLSLVRDTPPDLMGALLLGLIGVLWSFGGWHHASYVAGETINAKRTVPRAMILGAMIVTVMYVLINLAYMLLLPLDEIANTTKVAGDAVATIIPAGGQIMSIVIGISIFGTIGIYSMSAPRIYYAMAKDGIFFKSLAYVHPKFQTPVYAMLLQIVWTTGLLLFWGTFSNLITYVTFMDIAFMTLGGICVFLFRIKRPNQERPYRVLAYPIIPLIFVGISGAFVINTLIQRPEQALAGLGLLLIGIGVFYVLKNRARGSKF